MPSSIFITFWESLLRFGWVGLTAVLKFAVSFKWPKYEKDNIQVGVKGEPTRERYQRFLIFKRNLKKSAIGTYFNKCMNSITSMKRLILIWTTLSFTTFILYFVDIHIQIIVFSLFSNLNKMLLKIINYIHMDYICTVCIYSNHSFV